MSQYLMPESHKPHPFFSRLWLFWAAVLYITLLIGLISTYRATPDRLGGWSGVAVFGAVALFLVSYHGIYGPATFKWPLPYRRALFYFAIQLAIFVVLLHTSGSFVGIGFALLGQLFGSLPPRRWTVLAFAISAILAKPLGLLDQLANGDWLALASFILIISIWVVIGLIISKLIEQSHRLRDTIAELHKAKYDLEMAAAQTEELAALRERTRLAREMHDSIGHALVLVNVKLEAAERLYTRDVERGAAELEATRVLVRATMVDLRRSLADLRAPLPDHHDLPAALRQVAHDLQTHSQLAVDVLIAEGCPPLNPALSEALWRVAREALRNVEQHAAAASATIELAYHTETLILRISDDGSGIDLAEMQRPGHYGILGMRERIEALGGTLRVAPRAGGGTVVEACVPLS